MTSDLKSILQKHFRAGVADETKLAFEPGLNSGSGFPRGKISFLGLCPSVMFFSLNMITLVLGLPL